MGRFEDGVRGVCGVLSRSGTCQRGEREEWERKSATRSGLGARDGDVQRALTGLSSRGRLIRRVRGGARGADIAVVIEKEVVRVEVGELRKVVGGGDGGVGSLKVSRVVGRERVRRVEMISKPCCSLQRAGEMS